MYAKDMTTADIEVHIHDIYGMDFGGRKDVLGMWVAENESAKFWRMVLNGLRIRGVEDVFIACTDSLTGFSAASEAVTQKQRYRTASFTISEIPANTSLTRT